MLNAHPGQHQLSMAQKLTGKPLPLVTHHETGAHPTKNLKIKIFLAFSYLH